MMTKSNTITVFEHQTLRLNQNDDENKLLSVLKKLHGEKGIPYFSLTSNGVKFNEYVGVIQVGSQVIEILPKADKSLHQENSGNDEKDSWRKLLINMLKTVGVFDIKAPSSSSLKLNPNSVLELYYELLLNEMDYLVHRGLIKKYIKFEGNLNCLKGSIQFGKNIQKNLVHQERFYTKYTSYNVDHLLHQILFQAISLVSNLNRNSKLSSKISAVMLNFPEVANVKITDSVFNRIIFTRGNEHYRNAFSIARLLLLNFHPDVSKGHDNVLAIMFDMNVLWEKFVVSSLRKSFIKEKIMFEVQAQASKDFWAPLDSNRVRTIRPDIVIKNINKIEEKPFVIDTKWKNINKDGDISMDILRQMYVYHEYFHADKVAIVFPGEVLSTSGSFSSKAGEAVNKRCALLPIPIGSKIDILSINLFKEIYKWINST